MFINQILTELREAVVQYDEDKAGEWAGVALDEGVDPLRASLEGLAEGMAEVEGYSSERRAARGLSRPGGGAGSLRWCAHWR